MDCYFDDSRIEPCFLLNDIDVDIDSLHVDKHIVAN